MRKDLNKLSVIVPNYNSEKYLEKCLNSLLNQTYKNIEIILVNDCSKGNCDEIAKKYSGKIKYIKNETNKGLFHARIVGTDAATGDYITFLDSDDYVSIDFYRSLMNKAEETSADMIMGNMVLEFDNGKQVISNLSQMQFKELTKENILDEYLKQEGLNFTWHTIWNKIYSKELWNKARKHYEEQKEHLIMTEDFAFSTILFYYAQKLARVENDAIFYCQHEGTSTAINDINFKKIEKNLKDLNTSFSFVENFLKQVGVYEKYKKHIFNWKMLYCMQHRQYMKNAKLTDEQKVLVNNLFSKLSESKKEEKITNTFAYVETPWNNQLEKMKMKIADDKIKCVSFDIFDTLVVRPFFKPTDLLVLLNNVFSKEAKNQSGMDFSKIRINAEYRTREKLVNNNMQEITLDEIYNTIHKEYYIDKDLLEIMKQKEIEYEIRFCTRRNTAFELYSLAKSLGKKVICTSDMYLPKNVIEKILEKNGYKPDEVFISAEIKKTKWSGDLYKYVCDKLNFEPSAIIHIGDNMDSDVKTAKREGLNSMWLVKTVDAMTDEKICNNILKLFSTNLPYWRDNEASMGFIGIRTMIALVANKYFDNPYRPFNKSTDFNVDPYLVGYFAVGMYLYSTTRWLLKSTANKGYKNLVFMARDGYLPMEAYKILKKFYENVPNEKYLYVSRKALIPVTILNELDFYKLPEVINIETHTPRDILKYTNDVITIKDEETLKRICKENNIELDKNIKTFSKFNKFIKVVIDNFFDKEKHAKNIDILRKYFQEFYKEKSANFDIGYSGRPELYISNLCGYGIDTLFMNMNMDEALKHADMGNFKIDTFFEAKPSVTGFAYELIFSALAPSCIGYKIDENKVTPVFEEYNKTYPEEFVIRTMQEAALEFVSDMVNVFEDDLSSLYYQDYYTTLPIMAYINSSRIEDRLLFYSIDFEDNIRLKESSKMLDEWQKEIVHKKQRILPELYNSYNVIEEGLIYNTYIDLNNRSKFIRLIYYTFFDRPTLRRRISEILKNHPHILRSSKEKLSCIKKDKIFY